MTTVHAPDQNTKNTATDDEEEGFEETTTTTRRDAKETAQKSSQKSFTSSSESSSATQKWKRERIERYEKRFRKKDEEEEKSSSSESSSLIGTILGAAKGARRKRSGGDALKRGSRWIGNFHRYGSPEKKDFEDESDGTPRSSSAAATGTKSSASSPRLAGIEEDAILRGCTDEDDDTTTNENAQTKKSSLRRPATRAGGSSPRESPSEGKTSSKSVTFGGLPKTLSEKEQRRNERKREKEMAKYLEETTKLSLYGKEELQNEDDASLSFFTFDDIDGSKSYFGCISRIKVMVAMVAMGSLAFGGVSYSLFDPRGNSKVFGDINDEDDGNDNAFRAIALFGAVLGALVSGYLSDHAIGRKTVLSLSAGVTATLWSFFFGVSNSNGSLCDAPPFVPVLFACMCGMTCASWYSVAPVLLAETSPSRTRGRACALYITASSILGAFTFGELLKVIQTDDGSNNDKFYVVLFVLIFVVVCMGTFIAAIESPRWLLSRGRVIDAQHSCAQINDSNAVDSLRQMQDIKTDLERTSPEGSTSRFRWFDLVSKTKFTVATIVFSSLIVLQTFGTSSFYLFTSDETDEKVKDAYLYAYACMLIGMLVCAFRVDETSGFILHGRKSLIVMSFFILTLANSVRFTIAVVTDENDEDEVNDDAETSAIVFCNCFGAFGYGIGASSLPLLFATEWFPQHARQAAVASTAAFWYATFLLASITEEATMTLLGDILVFLAKAILCVLGGVVALYAIHETPTLSLEMAYVRYLESSGRGNLISDDDDDIEKGRSASRIKAYDALVTREQSLRVKTRR